MAETRRRRGKGDQTETPENPTKENYEIAKYLRNKCPKKQTKFFDDKVYYFTGSKAVDTLMESKWAKGKDKKVDQLFRDRHDCEGYLNKLLRLHLFIRGEKFEVKKEEKPKGKGKKSKDKAGEADEKTEGKDKKEKGTPKSTLKDKKEKSKAGKDDKSDEPSDDEPESPKTEAKDADKKKKKKIRLETHPDQVFLDSNDAYVWMYEPTSVKNIAIGAVIVLGSIGACLFPLWPPIVRQGVYYLSLCMVGLLGLLIGTASFRYVVFGVVWVLTRGNYSFWYLPNLTEDCGFFDSFKPAYTLTKKGDTPKGKKSKKKSKKSEEENETEETVPLKEDKAAESSSEKSPGRETSEKKSDTTPEDTSKRSPKLSPQVSLHEKDSDNASTNSEDAFEVINAGPEND